MKRHHSFIAGLLVSLACVATALAAESRHDDAHRFVFHAVLEGCFEDGLSTGDVSLILMKRGKETHFHFIYACPLCMPAINAFEVYQSRPARFFGEKGGASTFGSGLEPELSRQLRSEKVEDRLAVINSLLQRWIKRRMDTLRLTGEERAKLQTALEEKRKKGMETLKSFKANGSVAMLAPAFGERDECAVCNGAVGKPLQFRTSP